VKEHEREHHDFDPTMLYENCFLNQRLDGVVNNTNHRILNTLGFKRSSDRDEGFLGVKKDEANKQQKTSSRRSQRLPRNRRLNKII